MRLDLTYQRWTGFPILRELAGRQEQACCTVPQDIGVVYFNARQFWHWHRIHFGWRRLTAFQQLAGIFAFIIGASEILTEAPGFKLHFRSALITLQRRPVIALYPEGAVFYLVAGAIRIIATHMQLPFLINQIAVHRGGTLWAASLHAQQPCFALTFDILIGADDFITRDQINGGFTALFRRQRIT